MTRFRILHCLRAPIGGLFRHVCDLSAAQAAAGHIVGVLADSSVSDPLTGARLDGLRQHLGLGLHRAAMSRDIGWRDVTATRAATALAREIGATIIHGHGAKGGAYGRLAARWLKSTGLPVKAFYTPHGGSLHYAPSSLKGRVFMALERGLVRDTDGIIFESAYSAEVYARNVGPVGCAQRIIPNGLLPGEFTSDPPLSSATDILFIGELRYLKGVDILLRAIAQAGPNLTATIVGAGPDGDAFRALARELGLESRVTFTGAMPAVAAFRMGRVLIMPSLAESFPYVVLEAAAAGIPLIATSVGGIPEITAGIDTPLIAPGEVEPLVAAIRDCLADLHTARDRAVRLRAAVAARFTVANMSGSISDFYREASESTSLRKVS